MCVFWNLSGNISIFIVYAVCSGRKCCFMWHGTWNPLVLSDTRPCSPVATSNCCKNLCILEYCLKIIKIHCTFNTNCFSKHSKTIQVFLFSSTRLWIIFSFFRSEKRKGEEECEAQWCSSVCWMCLADVKSSCVFWFWTIFGTLVLTQDHCHYEKKAHDPLPWTEVSSFYNFCFFWNRN